MSHRIRLAMEGKLDTTFEPMGGLGAIVEVDETYIGKHDNVPHRVKGYWTKNVVLSLVERGGHVRSFHVNGHATADLAPYMNANIDKHSILVTDEGKWYTDTGRGFLDHLTVNHGQKEWKRGYAHTNTVEGFFSVFKRGMKGVSALLREAFAPVPCRVRFPLLEPGPAGRQRRGARRSAR